MIYNFKLICKLKLANCKQDILFLKLKGNAIMCGIIGINSKKDNVVDLVINGLKNLEYRGYDSAGVAGVINNQFEIVKSEGKIKALEEKVKKSGLNASLVIGHTRWATHGAPNQLNAHPHQTKQVSVVHNGIIENFMSLKAELIKQGYDFVSDTDSEVIPHLITYFLNKGLKPLDAVKETIKNLHGAFSIAAIFAEYPEILIAARKGSPLVVGYCEDKKMVASDAFALAFLTNRVTYLEEGDIALISSDKVEIYNAANALVNRDIVVINNNSANIGKGNFKHYMLKEIFEQPAILADTLSAYCNFTNAEISFTKIALNYKSISKISLVACGTSYYAANVAKYWMENFLDIPIEVDMASEFRYRNAYLPSQGLCVFLSQSGETADTLAALRYAKQKAQSTLSIINVKESSLDREADFSLECLAGPEISVASTKGFTSQLLVLLLFTLHCAVRMGKIDQDTLKEKLSIIAEIPGRISEILNCVETIQSIAKETSSAKNAIFIGRNYIYPVAQEGALKLKELSYIHAEAIAAGELKHGPIALVDQNILLIALAPYNNLFDKTASNMQEIASRGGNIISCSSITGNKILKNICKNQIDISQSDPLIEPIIYAIPMQLFAYHVAVAKGTDVDQPRNLAKSVTVE